MRIFLHNPKCSKSRDALKLISKSGKNFVLRNYVQGPLDYNELVDLQKMLGMKAIEFTRVGEKEFEENKLTKDSTDEQILRAMSKHPKLMERPIIYDERKAVIGRPVENILNIFRR